MCMCMSLYRLSDATRHGAPDPSRLLLSTAPRLARQNAIGFNQPLAWDVSSVSSMNQMFWVRSAACLRTACLMLLPRKIHLASHRALPRLAERTSFQPAARLERFEREQHEPDFLCAQRRLPLHHLSDATPSFMSWDPT